MTSKYDLIIVGTGFAGAFFLMRYLERAGGGARVLVLERGGEDSKGWQLQNRSASSIPANKVFVNLTPEKEWLTSPGFGGNSKCWWAGATRMMPGDFKLKSRYGVGQDWPMSYEDLMPHYDVVEQVMMISGPEKTPMPRSRPYPLPAHRMSDPDALLQAKFPEGWFAPITARASGPTGTRGICCATGICELCPVDAKFTIQNGLAHLYRDSRVTLQLNSAVDQVDTSAGIASGVQYTQHGVQQRAQADLVVLGASAMFNPHILLRSGIQDPLVGARLHEQMPVDVGLDLRGVKSYNGSTAISGNGYLFYEGEHRRDYAACLLETWNAPYTHGRPALRSEQGRWTERMYIRFLFDDLPDPRNTVSVSPDDARMAQAQFFGYSEYAQRGAAQIPKMVDKLAEALPIEKIVSVDIGDTSAHIQGTVVMGQSPADSVVDSFLAHHRIRNLLVLGASSFPTASPAYPSVTVSALSLRAADHLFASGANS